MNRGSCAYFAFRSASVDRSAFFTTFGLGRGHFGKILYLESVAVEGADVCAELGDDGLGKDGRSIEENGGGSGRRMKALSESIRGDVLHQEVEDEICERICGRATRKQEMRARRRLLLEKRRRSGWKIEWLRRKEERRGEERREEKRRGEERRGEDSTQEFGWGCCWWCACQVETSKLNSCKQPKGGQTESFSHTCEKQSRT